MRKGREETVVKKGRLCGCVVLCMTVLAWSGCGTDAPGGTGGDGEWEIEGDGERGGEDINGDGQDTDGDGESPEGVPTGLSASDDQARWVQLSWEGVEGATEYEIFRDDNRIAAVEATTREYLDSGAESPAAPGAPTNLQATEDRSDGVEVSWDFAMPASGRTHQYRVRAIFGDVQGELSEAVEGARAPFAVSFEVRGDGGDWIAAGEEGSFLDEEAPYGEVTAPGRARASKGGHLDRVFLEIRDLESLAGPSVAYEVRVVDGEHPEVVAGPVSGRRGSATPPLRWERSSGTSPAGYSEVSGAGSAPFSDLLAPADGSTRYWRARLEVPGFAAVYTEADYGYRAVDCAVEEDFQGQAGWVNANQDRAVEWTTTPLSGSANIQALWDATLPAPNWESGQVLSPPISIQGATVAATTFRENQQFFIQDGETGFQVYLDQALSQTVRVGQKVSFTATEVSVFNGNPQVTGLTGFSVLSEDNFVYFRDLNRDPLEIDEYYYGVVRLGGKLGTGVSCAGSYLCFDLAYGPADRRQAVSFRSSSPHAESGACVTYFGPVIGFPGPYTTLDQGPASRLQSDSFQWVWWEI